MNKKGCFSTGRSKIALVHHKGKISKGDYSVKKNWLSFTIIALIIFAMTSLAFAEVALKVPYVKKGPKIDGKLDDEAWTIAAQKGGKGALEWHLNGKPASHKTDILVCWDDDNLYIAYKNYQKKNTIIAEVFDDGGASFLTDDDNGSFISTTYPAGSWMQVITNPNGIRTTYGMGNNDSWDVAIDIQADYWVSEAAIPFDNFNEWPEVGDEWSGNFTRHIGVASGEGDTEWLSWSPLVRATFLDATTMCLLEFVK